MQSGADLNGDNLQISRVYLQISDYCSVTVRAGVRDRFADSQLLFARPSGE